MTTLLASPIDEKNLPGAQRGNGEGLALNAEAGAPEWIMLIPSGRLVVGRDKRKFTVYDPGAIIAATEPFLPLVVDYEHDFEFRKPGDATPAAGWIKALEVRDGAIFGQVEWTKRAANAIAEKEYRFISPAFFHADTEEAAISRLSSAGLVHRPNFVMPALNFQDPTMDKDLLKALSLPETATSADVLVAVNALQTPAPTKYVPRADYDQAMTRATNAESELAAIRETQTKAAAAALVDAGIAEGKIAPASREHYLKLALASRADVEALLQSAPAIIAPGADAGLKKEDPAKGGEGLSESQKAVCAQLGLSEDQYKKAMG